jgi:hypothetical protein
MDTKTTVLGGVVEYLKDWKNWVMHAIIGIGILVIAAFLPVPPIVRVGLIFVVIAFNMWRMKREKRKQAEAV